MEDWEKVKSSNIEAVKYEDGDLFVKFKTGAVYKYRGVSRSMVEELVAAPSAGKFFAEFIKNDYSYERIK